MSRHYKLFVTVIGITEEQLLEVCSNEFAWDGETSCWKEEVTFDGEGRLCGGQSEFDAHEEICEAIKKINSEAKFNTQWTYMEDLPYEEYGDDID